MMLAGLCLVSGPFLGFVMGKEGVVRTTAWVIKLRGDKTTIIIGPVGRNCSRRVVADLEQ